jgi:hypothetical protein
VASQVEKIVSEVGAFGPRDDLPGLAAADQMIKRLMVAVEDDLDALVIRPRLRRIRQFARRREIELGVVQRTGILATDRRPAGVSPKATIEFDFPEAPDLLQEAAALTRLVAATQTGGLALAPMASPVSQGLGMGAPGVEGILQQLSGQPVEQPPRIYKVETGTDLDLVPIVLPDGQTVGFDLEYALTTPVRDPALREGRRVGKVDRHFFHTYVQDTSFELRELSRFETQTKVGEPPSRSGGIPLLKEIPIIREIPLIGYFSRRAGTAAGLQESLVFVHAVTYPTIANMTALIQ